MRIDREILRSKDKSEEWHHTPPRQQRRTSAENIVQGKMGFTKDVMRRVDSPVTAFSNFITTENVEKIVENTNHAIEAKGLIYDRVTLVDKKIHWCILIDWPSKRQKYEKSWNFGPSMVKML